MGKCITPSGDLSGSQECINHIDRLIAGLELAQILIAKSKNGELDGVDDWQLKRFMSHYVGDYSFGGNHHTERGHDCEPDAIAAMSDAVGKQIHDAGLVIMGDDPNGVVSCSPDGLIYESGRVISGAEIKSPTLSKWLGHAVDAILPDEYKLQVHACMAICETDIWHFGSYFRGKPLIHVEAKRSRYTDALERSLIEFRGLYENRYYAIRQSIERIKEQNQLL